MATSHAAARNPRRRLLHRMHALERRGVTAVLTGGSAATFYARGVPVPRRGMRPRDLRERCGGQGGSRGARLRAPKRHVRACDEPVHGRVSTWSACDRHRPHSPSTVRRADETLNVLTATDSVRDRLANFYYFRDLQSMHVAVAVASAQIDTVDLATIEDWTHREADEAPAYAQVDRFAEFRAALDRAIAGRREEIG
jgi:hypothetical protein